MSLTGALEALPGLPASLAGLSIRRLLPRSRRRLVGSWCFADVYGPLEVAPGLRMDVAPHPHIGLQTVSWLVAGELVHDDSLGFRGHARPGVLNLMTAGAGIAHSERSPPAAAGPLHGVQLWLALPDAHRQTAPGFEQHAELPEAALAGGGARVVMGELAGRRSPARSFSALVAADIAPEAGGRCVVPVDPAFEHALVPLSGSARLEGTPLEPGTLYYAGTGRRELLLEHSAPGTRLMLLGGPPFQETILIWWNFVARTRDEIAAAREDWQAGRRFGHVAAYAGARLDAPPLVARPVPPTPAS